jgi:tetratricopeptide (TPR) repeat protein
VTIETPILKKRAGFFIAGQHVGRGFIPIRKKKGVTMEMRNVHRNISITFVFIMVFLLSATTTSAKMVTYTKEYNYQAGEADSKLSARTIALEQVKRLLLEELGTYIVSETTVKNFELTKDQISCFTTGIVMTVIIEEKWDGKTYFLKAKIATDTDELVRLIDQLRRDHEQSTNWEEMRKKTEEALKEIERLKKEIEKGKGDKVSQEKYDKAVNELNAVDWFKKGVRGYRTKNYQDAMKAYDKAIEIDPNYAGAYAGRASIYNQWGKHAQALQESEQAVKIDPNLAWGFNTRGYAQIGLLNYPKGIEDLNKAMELAPKYAWPYCNRSWAYFMLKNYHQAIEDANRAIELDPKLPQAYFRRGRALLSTNNLQDAIKSFDKTVQLDPTFSWAFLQRGYTLLKLGKTEEAVENFKRAANLGNKDAENYLKRKGIPW